jgi:hypothetical protein
MCTGILESPVAPVGKLFFVLSDLITHPGPKGGGLVAGQLAELVALGEI